MPDKSRSEIHWWWVGPTDSLDYNGFLRWLASDPPRHPEATWRVTNVSYATLSLPRLTFRTSEKNTADRGILVWQIPEHGIADLIGQIMAVQLTRPGYLHFAAGLASPGEWMRLSEIGVTAHMDRSAQWSRSEPIVLRVCESGGG